MATKKASKRSKHLRKAKKLEATKPLSKLMDAACKGTHIPEVVIE
jgi:hypothetical protein